jgi:hypothetical protein
MRIPYYAHIAERLTAAPAGVAAILLIAGCSMPQANDINTVANNVSAQSPQSAIGSNPIGYPTTHRPAITEASIQELDAKGEPVGSAKQVSLLVPTLGSVSQSLFTDPRFTLRAYQSVGQTFGGRADPTRIMNYTLDSAGATNQGISGEMAFPFSNKTEQSKTSDYQVFMGGVPYAVSVTVTMPRYIKHHGKARLNGAQRFPDE